MATKAKLPSTAVGRRRLLKLAGLLEADASRKRGIKFDLQLWGHTSVAKSGFDVPDTIPVNCNTTACAVGLACISGAFARQGLHSHVSSRLARGGNNVTPLFQDYRGVDAVEEFFTLTGSQFNFLFVDDSYGVTKGAVAERAVAKRIRDFVAGRATP